MGLGLKMPELLQATILWVEGVVVMGSAGDGIEGKEFELLEVDVLLRG